MEHHQTLFLAETWVRMKRGEKALKVLETASPDVAATWLWRSNALHLLDRHPEAIDAARRGLAIDGESPYLHHALSWSWRSSPGSRPDVQSGA